MICGAGGRSNLEDPYITLPEEEAGSDDEDDTLRDSDLLILAARNDDDVSHLEVRYRVEDYQPHGQFPPCTHGYDSTALCNRRPAHPGRPQ